MALTQLTKIDGGGISTTSDYRVGVITATKFIGPFEGSTGTFSGNITAVDGTFSGNVTVGGTLTYEDVTNIDSVGILTARAGIFIDDSITHIGDTNTKIRFPADDTVSVETGGTERLRIKSDGKVGLGTDNPSQLLHLEKDSYHQILLKRVGASPGEVSLRNEGNVAVLANNVSGIDFQTGATPSSSMRITSAGKVGIGTISPVSLLHLYSGGPQLQWTDSDDNSDSKIRYNSPNMIIETDVNDEADDSIISFRIDGSTVSSEKVRIESDGKVGIGTDNPTEKLTVLGNVLVKQFAGTEAKIQINETSTNNAFNIKQTATQALIQTTASQPLNIRAQAGSGSTSYLAFWTRDDERLRITSDGKIGMGVDAPTFSAINSISANAARGIEIFKNGSDTGSAIKLAGDNGSGTKAWSQLGYSGANATAHWANYNTSGTLQGQIVIGSTGKIGINETTPEEILDLGEANQQNLKVGQRGYLGQAYSTSATILGHSVKAKTTGTTAGGMIVTETNSGGGAPSAIRQESGTIQFHTAGSGTADADFDSERLRIDASGHITPGAAGTQDLGSTSKEFRHLYLGDSGKVQLGLDQDFTLWHNNSHGLIKNTTGRLYVLSDDVWFKNEADNKTSARFFEGNEVFLYHNDTVRLTTTSTGITVTGEVASSQDYPNQRPSVDFNFVSVKKLDPRFTYRCTGPASYTDEFGKVVLVGDNTPRFDHDPTTRECKGLLIEESRTNYCRSSSDFSNLWASSTGGYGIDNAITNPDGTVGAQYHTGAEWYHIMDLSGASTNVITISAWVKERSGQSGNLSFQVFQQVSGSVVDMGSFHFNPATGVLGTADANFSDGIVTEYPNGWYRISVKATTDSGNFSSSARIDQQGEEHYVWGVQVEAGSYATSYIPTNGTTATRGQGFAVIDGEELSDFYNPNASTVICQFDTSNWMTYNKTKYERIFAFGNLNSENEVVEMFKSHTSATELRWRIRSGGSNVLGAANTTYSPNHIPKFGMAWQLNDAGVCVDGGTVQGTSDSGIPIPSITQLSLGNSCIENNNGNHGYTGWIRRFIYYPIKVSDAQLVTLTS